MKKYLGILIKGNPARLDHSDESQKTIVGDFYRLENGVVTQLNTMCGDQDFPEKARDISLSPEGEIVIHFEDESQPECVQPSPTNLSYQSIDEATGDAVFSLKNRDSLRKGLLQGSEKTLAWFKTHGMEARQPEAAKPKPYQKKEAQDICDIPV